MEKIYKVFVSSTYEDLKEERSEVIQALLELDCVPVGMELFPASNEEQWEFIRKVIEECDYYVLILGGRYGSCGNDGIGYTEKEFLYAQEKNIPILTFIHKNPEEIPSGKRDKGEEARLKYDEFRKMAQKGRLCKYWSNAQELGGLVSRSISHIKKSCPRTGWVRADKVSNEDNLVEILRLKKENEELNKQLNTPPENVGDLAQGEDLFTINYEWTNDDVTHYLHKENAIWHLESHSLSYDAIFSFLAIDLIHECSKGSVKGCLEKHLKQVFLKNKKTVKIIDDNFHTILVQLEALGLIQQIKKSYWKLTSYGKKYMMKIKTVKKEKAGQIATSG